MSPDKHALRAKYRKLRAEMSEEQLELGSQLIAAQTAKFLMLHSDLLHFHLFFPMARQREINTFLIKTLLDSKGATVYTSRVSKHSIVMETLKLKPDTRFAMDSWGIPLPQDFELADASAIQVVFIPLLAYDQAGNRIGFGKGYYDVFLEGLAPSVLKVGLSFFPPEIHIPAESHDIPLDYCITPENILNF
ncbi:5-formyltetrahydrofolate cyclo-ligase [Algoriphagus halophytocola]|uniref:5-formyltetrahydrofolate cyclo-ligase n=1 Tax=Algoriphagus halophytocola TaxID=2991499 RepID=A0ABY6MBS9_9BACT|nr:MULTISPECIES: 5-formyltetrahydrofolate cyclo-ligase [unclassified Algoriphagus]UZD21030.1 5-formyltetrahydrofolate cyclo-ligase [Algoriphagus sp. TR-M5]WBL42196.1 5-formyltetrahydrofolate cyclo-ligase [Algoriphagus sp. TR-M9]